MKKKKRRARRTYDPAFKASAVARVLRGRASRTETQRQIADELGITETQLSAWARQLGKKARSDEALQSPTIELRGLRAWVNHAVRLEVDRVLALKGIK